LRAIRLEWAAVGLATLRRASTRLTFAANPETHTNPRFEGASQFLEGLGRRREFKITTAYQFTGKASTVEFELVAFWDWQNAAKIRSKAWGHADRVIAGIAIEPAPVYDSALRKILRFCQNPKRQISITTKRVTGKPLI
jgi:hypothetical protein